MIKHQTIITATNEIDYSKYVTHRMSYVERQDLNPGEWSFIKELNAFKCNTTGGNYWDLVFELGELNVGDILEFSLYFKSKVTENVSIVLRRKSNGDAIFLNQIAASDVFKQIEGLAVVSHNDEYRLTVGFEHGTENKIFYVRDMGLKISKSKGNKDFYRCMINRDGGKFKETASRKNDLFNLNEIDDYSLEVTFEELKDNENRLFSFVAVSNYGQGKRYVCKSGNESSDSLTLKFYDGNDNSEIKLSDLRDGIYVTVYAVL